MGRCRLASPHQFADLRVNRFACVVDAVQRAPHRGANDSAGILRALEPIVGEFLDLLADQLRLREIVRVNAEILAAIVGDRWVVLHQTVELRLRSVRLLRLECIQRAERLHRRRKQVLRSGDQGVRAFQSRRSGCAEFGLELRPKQLMKSLFFGVFRLADRVPTVGDGADERLILGRVALQLFRWKRAHPPVLIERVLVEVELLDDRVQLRDPVHYNLEL